MWRRFAWSLGVALLLAGLVALGLARGWWLANHPDPARFPVRGVDVSHHQGHIDWAAVATTPHVRFAYVKATEGGDWTDHLFREHWDGARAAGLRVGAYHFFTFCRPAADQARHFLAVLPPDPDQLPPAVDVEYGGNCRQGPPAEAVRASLTEFLRLVEAATGRRPIVYVTREAHTDFVEGAGLPHPLWIRNVWWEPAAPWALWQFASRGRVPGIPGLVDLNVFTGDAAAFARF